MKNKNEIHIHPVRYGDSVRIEAPIGSTIEIFDSRGVLVFDIRIVDVSICGASGKVIRFEAICPTGNAIGESQDVQEDKNTRAVEWSPSKFCGSDVFFLCATTLAGEEHVLRIDYSPS
jgi:hypothetical protein